MYRNQIRLLIFCNVLRLRKISQRVVESIKKYSRRFFFISHLGLENIKFEIVVDNPLIVTVDEFTWKLVNKRIVLEEFLRLIFSQMKSEPNGQILISLFLFKKYFKQKIVRFQIARNVYIILLIFDDTRST